MGAKTPDPEQVRQLRARAESRAAESHAAHELVMARLQKSYGPFFRAKAVHALQEGHVRLRTDRGIVAARVIRFRDGTGVLEHLQEGSDSSGHGLTRLEPDHLQADVIGQYLMNQVAQLHPDAVPFPD